MERTQYTIFDMLNSDENDNIEDVNNSSDLVSVTLTDDDIKRFKYYNLKDYCKDIEALGIEKAWSLICNYVLKFGENKKSFLNVNNFGEMYEIGLAIIDKQQKKNSGQYYTPDDVARVMAEWFSQIQAENICDVACGTGKLILSYFDYIGEEKTKQVLNDSRLYLYDLDKVALHICKTSILLKYGIEYKEKIHDIYGDFLNKNLKLPKNCKVISNPPYAAMSSIPRSWRHTDVVEESKELYSAFMEKIIEESNCSVIITPYSFIGGKKFFSLRKLMNNYNGFIVSFDNVPGNIFCGRKHGVFNTNTSNSVRASITVVENNDTQKGFRLSPLIRFKNEEREKLLQSEFLKTFLSDKRQIVDKKHQLYSKCFKELQEVFDVWCKKSTSSIRKIICNNGKYKIYFPNTCRYFTVGAKRKLNRTGLLELKIEDKNIWEFIYCLVNSSFAYLWWRVYDGGITYPTGLLYDLPVFYDLLSEDDKMFFENICAKMVSVENNCIVTKLNAGAYQENIKFPKEYRDNINKRLLTILGFDNNISFDIIHSNKVFKGGLDEDE